MPQLICNGVYLQLVGITLGVLNTIKGIVLATLIRGRASLANGQPAAATANAAWRKGFTAVTTALR